MSGVGPSDAQLSRFLLGTLPEEEHAEIEERLFTDEDLQSALDGATDDLVHAYLADQLSADQRAAFDTHFLAAARHRERLSFVRDLMEATRRAALRDEARAIARPRPWLLAAAAVLATLAALAGLFAWTRDKGPRQAVASPSAPPTPSQAASPTAVAIATPMAGPASSPAPSRNDEVRIVRLAAGRSSDAAEIVVTPATRSVRLEVPVEAGPPSYDAVLRNAAGVEAWRAEGLAPAAPGEPLVLSVPTDDLASGEYVLTIEGEALRGQPVEPLERRLSVVRRRR